jgi:hypothetical protein
VFVPSDVVRQAATAVAEREGLAEDWLNDAVKGFLPGPDPDAQRFYSSECHAVGHIRDHRDHPLTARRELVQAFLAPGHRDHVRACLVQDPGEASAAPS